MRGRVTQVAAVCAFCDDDAVSAYRDLLFCRWHLVMFYLALDGDWHG